MVGNFLSDQGFSRGVCEDLAERLHQNGWRVITTSSARGRVHKLVDMLWTAWRFRSAYQVVQVDVFSGASFRWAELVCELVRRLKKPYVLTLHGGGLPEFSAREPARVARLLKYAAAVTAPSRYMRERMEPFMEEIHLIPNPLDLVIYPFRRRTKPEPMLVWLRAFHHIYNPRLAVQVAGVLSDRYPDLQLVMIGPDKNDGSLQAVQQEIVRRGLGTRVEIVPGIPKNEVPQRLAEGDIFLNTSSVDNTPVSVIEAMAAGLCIVSTDVGGMPYLLEAEVNALLVPPDDAPAMAEAVARFLEQPELAEKCSLAARERAGAFDWSEVYPRWEKLLASAVTGCSASVR